MNIFTVSGRDLRVLIRRESQKMFIVIIDGYIFSLILFSFANLTYSRSFFPLFTCSLLSEQKLFVAQCLAPLPFQINIIPLFQKSLGQLFAFR